MVSSRGCRFLQQPAAQAPHKTHVSTPKTALTAIVITTPGIHHQPLKNTLHIPRHAIMAQIPKKDGTEVTAPAIVVVHVGVVDGGGFALFFHAVVFVLHFVRVQA
jgi:hypothetical protein